MNEGIYGVRYFCEPWNKPMEGETKEVQSGIKICKGNYGYADDVLIASIIRDEKRPSKVSFCFPVRKVA